MMDWLRRRFGFQARTRTTTRRQGAVTYTQSRPDVRLKFSLFDSKPRRRATPPRPPQRPRVTQKLDQWVFCPNCNRQVMKLDHWCPRCCADFTIPELKPTPEPSGQPFGKTFARPHTAQARAERKAITVRSHMRSGQKIASHTRNRPGKE